MRFLIIFLVLTSAHIFAQEKDSITYHSERTYKYTTYEDKDLIKLKTETYIIKLKKQGFTITKNEIKQYKFDININSISDNKNIVTFNVVYSFFDSFYTIDLWSPKMYIAKTKKWITISKYKEVDANLRAIIEDVTFKDFENDVNANF